MGNIFQVSLKQTWLLQQVRNVFYYETQVGDPSDSEWIDIADEIRSDYVTEMVAGLVPEWGFNAIDTRRVDIAGLLAREFVPTLGTVVGTSGGDSLATQIALLVSVKGVTTKPNRARSYLGGFAEGSLQDSQWVGGSLGNGQDFIDEMSVLNGAGTNPLFRVAAQWNTSHTLVSVWNDISGSASIASVVPATQRRRRIGVGI